MAHADFYQARARTVRGRPRDGMDTFSPIWATRLRLHLDTQLPAVTRSCYAVLRHSRRRWVLQTVAPLTPIIGLIE